MKPNPTGSPRVPSPSSALLTAITQQFHSFHDFQQAFTRTATNVFGSGWAWLVMNVETQELSVLSTPNQDHPIMRSSALRALLCLDVWEHVSFCCVWMCGSM